MEYITVPVCVAIEKWCSVPTKNLKKPTTFSVLKFFRFEISNMQIVA